MPLIPFLQKNPATLASIDAKIAETETKIATLKAEQVPHAIGAISGEPNATREYDRLDLAIGRAEADLSKLLRARPEAAARVDADQRATAERRKREHIEAVKASAQGLHSQVDEAVALAATLGEMVREIDHAATQLRIKVGHFENDGPLLQFQKALHTLLLLQINSPARREIIEAGFPADKRTLQAWLPPVDYLTAEAERNVA
jgi:hypothetical protein